MMKRCEPPPLCTGRGTALAVEGLLGSDELRRVTLYSSTIPSVSYR